MNTPYFLISKNKLDHNINAFRAAFDSLWNNSILGYSVKTNSLPWLLTYLQTNNLYAEVVSDEEYDLALKCGFKDNQLIFNGPIKGEVFFARAIKNGAFLNLDSKNDLKYLTKYKAKDPSHIGVRINMPPQIFDSNDIEYAKDGFRFGFSEKSGELREAITAIQDVYGSNTFGLHLHFNSVTRSINVYRATARYAIEIVKKYNLSPSFIDIGGGFFGGVEGKPTPTDYIKAVKEIFEDEIDIKKTTLIVEPGSAIIGSVVDFHTSVLDVKKNEKTTIITTDGSRIHIDPLWIKSRYMYSIDSKLSKIPRQVICGYTCMDHDRLMILENENELSQGDRIVYHRVGAYSMTFGGMFIKHYPDVFVDTGNDLIKVRTGSTTDDYYHLHS